MTPVSSFDGGPLPGGFRVALDRGARRVGDGSVLIGGSPVRLLRLTPAGRVVVDRLAAGEPVPGSPAAQRLARRLLDGGLAHPRPPAPDASPEAAVVIPVHDDLPGLTATLHALRPRSTTVVVDDASPRRTGDLPRGTILVRRAVRGGPAAARNDGWRTVGEPFVAFVDANCEPEPDWLQVLLPHFADPNVAAVAPRVLPPAGFDRTSALAAYESVSSPLDLGGTEATVRPRSPVAYVPTAALVVRREALEALGGFDETLTVGEDVDFVWRLVEAGWTVRYEPRATVRHPPRPDWAAWAKQRYRYGTSAAALAARHGRAVAPAVVSPWTAAAWFLVAAGHPGLGAAVAGYSVVALARRGPGPAPAKLPRMEVVRLAGFGHLRGGLALARAVRRAWPPLAVLVGFTCRRSRPALVAAVVVPCLLEWRERRPPLDPGRYLGLRLADDLAYAAGVWAGCVKKGSFRALLPDFRSARSGAVRETNDPVVASIGGST